MGGLGEIGMNCLVLEANNEAIMIDCGLIFADLDHFGVEYGVPDFSQIEEIKDKITAVVITHGHEDHIGALAYAIRAGIKAPIFACPFTKALIEDRLRQAGVLSGVKFNVFQPGSLLNFNEFKIKTVPVNHSIIESVALLIDTPAGKIVHTGDFRIDPNPFYGEKINLQDFKKAGDEGVLLFLSDSTNVEFEEEGLSESVIYEQFEKIFSNTRGLTVVTMFSSNICRLGQIFKLANKIGLKVAVTGRSMSDNIEFAIDNGYLTDAKAVLIPVEDLDKHPREKVILLAAGCQGEYRSAFSRIAKDEHKFIDLREDDIVVYSARVIPGNEKPVGNTFNKIYKQEAEVVSGYHHKIHASGHATRPELKKMLEFVRPKFFLPVHGEYRFLSKHALLAKETGVSEENIIIAQNGDIYDLQNNLMRLIGSTDEVRVWIGSRQNDIITKTILRERRRMAERGVVISTLLKNKEGRVRADLINLKSYGFACDALSEELMTEAQRIVAGVVKRYNDELDGSFAEPFNLAEEVRIDLRRYFGNTLGLKPPVISTVIDL